MSPDDKQPSPGPGEQQLHAAVEQRFGVLPNFFRLAPECPEITANLWGFARFAYLDNPLPSLFKERLFVHLSRFCEVRYCISRHVGFLVGLGRPSGDERCAVQTTEEVVRLLRHPVPRGDEIEPFLARCAAADPLLAAMPGSDSAMEQAVFACSAHVFLRTPQAPQCLAALKRLLRPADFEYLMVFLGFIRTAHDWTRVHTELTFEDDIEQLLRTHEQLAECLLSDRDPASCEVSERILGELASLRQNESSRNQALQEAEAAVHASQAQFETLVNQAPLGVYLVDAGFHIREANPTTVSALGDAVGPGGVVGRDFEEILHVLWEQNYVDEIMRIFRHTLETGESFAMRERAVRRIDRGGTEYYEWRLDRITLPDGRHGVVCYFRDISQQVQAREAIARLVGQLQEQDRRKDEFLATLAHELRNPLAPIRNALSILKHDQVKPEELNRTREMMERQVVHMVRLIDDLLDVSRISRGKLELRCGHVELAAVIHQAVETCRPTFEGAGHEVTVTLPLEPVYLDADSFRLSQVFGNLLSNACKFMEPGGRVWLTAERQGSGVVVSVTDTGIGIPPDKIDSIFEMFSQVDKTLERSQTGLGIGLTLAKRLVELHGGSIEARSAGPGKGSEFVVRLPAVTEKSPPQPSQEPAEEPAVTNRRRILVVDDNEDSAESLAILLTLKGNETHTASNGQEAVEAAARLRPDVILLDIGMPTMNGYEACRRIREQPGGDDVVIIALTGWGQDEDRRRSSEAGFNEHLVKPLDPAVLMKLLAATA
ncbi:MAG TPA: ATP-binding protein [Thermoanaerobaculia bacterium]|nr:ATP-binding protein [Thermoanaerobaculia bacterium]